MLKIRPKCGETMPDFQISYRILLCFVALCYIALLQPPLNVVSYTFRSILSFYRIMDYLLRIVLQQQASDEWAVSRADADHVKAENVDKYNTLSHVLFLMHIGTSTRKSALLPKWKF